MEKRGKALSIPRNEVKGRVLRRQNAGLQRKTMRVSAEGIAERERLCCLSSVKRGSNILINKKNPYGKLPQLRG